MLTALLGQNHKNDMMRCQETESDVGVAFRHRATTYCFLRCPQVTSKVLCALVDMGRRVVSDTTTCLSVDGNYLLAVSAHSGWSSRL